MSWIDDIVQREPWLPVASVEAERPGWVQKVADELRREIKPGHALAEEAWRIVGLSTRRDDALLELDCQRAAAVHVTWNPNERPPWPTCAIVASAEELNYEWLD